MPPQKPLKSRVFSRLHPQEVAIIDKARTWFYRGIKSLVVEEALQRFLVMAEDTGSFPHYVLLPVPDEMKGGANFLVRTTVVRRMKNLESKYKWTIERMVRNAVIDFGMTFDIISSVPRAEHEVIVPKVMGKCKMRGEFNDSELRRMDSLVQRFDYKGRSAFVAQAFRQMLPDVRESGQLSFSHDLNSNPPYSRRGFVIDDEQAALVRETSLQSGVSLRELVRCLVLSFMDELEQPPTRSRRRS